MRLKIQVWHSVPKKKPVLNRDIWFTHVPKRRFELVDGSALEDHKLADFLSSHIRDTPNVEIWVRLVSLGPIQKYSSPSFRGQASSKPAVFFLGKPTRIFAGIVKETGGKCFVAFWDPSTGEVKNFPYDGRKDECFEQPKEEGVIIGVIGILPSATKKEE